MEFTEILGKLNWWAVLLATLSSFVVGFLWYDKRAFGKQWMKLVGLTEKQLNSSKNMGATFTWTGIASLLSAVTLGYLMIALGVSGLLEGLLFGGVIGAAFRLGGHVIHNGFSRRPAALTAIDGGHDIIALATMGALLGMWM